MLLRNTINVLNRGSSPLIVAKSTEIALIDFQHKEH